MYYVDSLVPAIMKIEHKPFRAGLSLNYGWNQFDSIAGHTLPENMSEGQCDYYEHGSGNSIQGGLHIEYPLWGDVSPFSLLLGLGYRSTSGTLRYAATYPTGGLDQPFHVDLHHRSSGIALSPGIAIELSKHLRFTLQPELDFFFYKKYFKTIVLDGSSFPEETSERSLQVLRETDSARTFNGAIRSTIGYEVPLSSKMWAEPQAGITIPLFGVTPYWYAWRFDVGISVHYDLTPRFETIEVYNSVKVPRYVAREVQTPPPPKIKASISAIGIGRDGTESPVVNMSIEEVRSRNAYPVLTYVFFDENSSSIPSRYKQYSSASEAQREFKGADIRENLKPLELYQEVLNILGSRLKANRNATVRLIGTVSNAGSEQGDLQLARSRAETVKAYLTKVWSIASNRISIEAKLDPDKPSPNTTQQGREENRRVEFILSDERLSDPVTVLNTERLATPDRVRLLPYIEADTNEVKIKSLKAWVLAGDRELMALSGNMRGFPGAKPWSVTEKDILQFKDSLQLRLDVEDEEGHVYTALGSLPISVAQNTTDKPERIERFSLILFDFDQSRIEDKNARMIDRVAKALPTLKAERITIVGHTDESGSEEYNDKLSKMRAEEAKLALEKAAMQASIKLPSRVLTDGLGSREKLFDNRLPEGRFYSRTVNITVEKKQ